MLNEIYKYHKEWVKVACKYLKNKEDAEDLVQDVYIKIIDKINNNKISVDEIRYKNTVNKNFIYKIIRNSAIDELRKRKEKIDFIKFDEDEDFINARDKILTKLQNEINILHEKDKEIFKLYI